MDSLYQYKNIYRSNKSLYFYVFQEVYGYWFFDDIGSFLNNFFYHKLKKLTKQLLNIWKNCIEWALT